MSQTERLIMAEGTQGSGPEGSLSVSGTAVAKEPDVVVAPETTQPPEQSWWNRVRGVGREQPQVLVKPGEYRAQLSQPPPDQSPQTSQPPEQNLWNRPRPPSEGEGGDHGHEGEPPDRNSLEFDASPERGREIVLKIKKWEGLLYAGRFAEVDWKDFDQAYKDERTHIEAYRIISRDLQIDEGEDESKPEIKPILKVEVNNLKNPDGTDFLPPGQLVEAYKKKEIDKDTYIRQANGYFKEARRIGLLDTLTDVLSSIYVEQVMLGIGRKTPSARMMYGIQSEITEALDLLNETIKDQSFVDSEIGGLIGVAELYSVFAKGRFSSAIITHDADGVTQRPYEITEEFHLEEPEDSPKQRFWHIDHVYPIIEAQTPEEYEIAADTYIGSLETTTTSPQKIIERIEYFIQAIATSASFETIKKNHPLFLIRLVSQIEGRLGFFGGDHADELYHGDDYDAYLKFLNKDGGGPERWLGTAQLREGKVAAALWIMDNDPEMQVLFSQYGSRGHLSEYSYAQKGRKDHLGLYNEIHDLMVERMMGIKLRNKKNMSKVTSFMSDKEFTGMFEGLFRYDMVPQGREHGDVNIKAYNEAIAALPADGKLTDAQLKDKKIRLGKIQSELQEIRSKITNGGLELERGQMAWALLDEKDTKYYKDAWEDASKEVEIALEMYGVMGEKSKRAGDVLIIDKVDVDGKAFQELMPVNYAQNVVQFAETWTKIKYADDAELWKKPDFAIQMHPKLDGKPNPKYIRNFRAKYRAAMVEIASTRAISGIKTKGFEVMLEDADYDPYYLTKAIGVDGKHLRSQDDKKTRNRLNRDGNFSRIDGLREGEPRPMILKRPTEYVYPRDAEGKIITAGAPKDELVRDADGKVIVESVPVGFYIATHHSYGDWTGHTYWSYQEEDRHLLLAPATYVQAKEIRDGKLRPEASKTVDSIAIQRLILDPSLKRVRRFIGEHSEERERKLTMAAVEDSYQGHFRIARELYRAFLPKYGTPTSDIKVYYALQDVGGWRKILQSTRGQVAEDPERFARRGRRLEADLHNPVTALSDYLGQGTRGALGPLRMMEYPVYRSFGSMALDKFEANAKYGGKVRGALIEDTDQEGNYIEALLLKLTNESDELQELREKFIVGTDWRNADTQHTFANAIRKSFGRLEKYLKILVVMESKTRNASGAADLEEVDILKDGENLDPEFERRLDALPDIKEDVSRDELAAFLDEFEAIEKMSEKEFNEKFNTGTDEPGMEVIPGIDEGDISANTGSGRHSARIFFDTFIDLMIDMEKRGGGRSYKNEQHIYSHIDDRIIYYDPTQQKVDPKGIRVTEETIRDWLFGKLVPT